MAELSWHQAYARAGDAVGVGPRERIDLSQSLDRTLATDVAARIDLPSFATAAMDGWVVCGVGPWRITGTVDAGNPAVEALNDGQAMRIATGAAVPEGASSVVPWEIASVSGDVITAEVPDKWHVRPAGEECRAGEILASAGDRVNPALLGSLAAAGVDQVDVVIPPRVQVLLLGDEVVHSGMPEHGQVRDALGVQLPGWVNALGGVVVGTAAVRDDLLELTQAVSTAIKQADIVVCTGGTSRGHRDFLRAALSDCDAEWLVDGVHVRPGHPMMLAAVRGVPVIGLPGNPLSALVALATLAIPVFASWAGRAERRLPRVQMAEEIPAARKDLTRLMVGRRELGGFREVEHVSSAMLRGIAHADGWAVVPAAGVAAGEVVEWIPVPWSRQTHDA